jgi:hypothetical protein
VVTASRDIRYHDAIEGRRVKMGMGDVRGDRLGVISIAFHHEYLSSNRYKYPDFPPVTDP